MSAVVKTRTPFICKDVLMEALDKLGVNYRQVGEELVTERKDYYGFQTFEFHEGSYLLRHDSSVNDLKVYPIYPWAHDFKDFKTIDQFLAAVENQYKTIEQKMEEAERLRLEKEKQQYIEQKKQAIIQKAKAQGYSIKEKQKGKSVQLVLVRTTY